MSSELIENVEFPDVESASSGEGDKLIEKNVSLVSHVKASAKVFAGSAEIEIGELFSLKKGSVVSLKEKVDEPFSLKVNGKCIARGHLVVVDDTFGFEVTDVL